MSEQSPKIGIDHPLQVGSALKDDKLARGTFAQSVVASLQSVSSTAGFVLSVEGVWGSGKTSTLAMIDELLRLKPESERPAIVHFNPWLVGDRDALLGQFLSKLASAVAQSDHANEGKKAAKTIKSYAEAFDVLKLIPGAEPWATIVKSVFESVGKATGAIAEYKTPDIEQRKESVATALREYPRPIIVFIDDIDRLFPLEVFEMVRIIKAVGDLPHVGYVLAWDPAYVSCALASANVPQADTYLDKVVQVRMTLPSLSLSARSRLINDSLKILHLDALNPHFKNHGDRLSGLYFSGLRELLVGPRDVVRVFNTVNIIEPVLRGEVVFSDILGLAALMVKAPTVFQLLRKNPEWFVGRLPGDSPLRPSSEDIIKVGADARENAFKSCANPNATQRVVYFLFPLIAKAADEFTFNRVVGVEGHIAHPARLLVALQLTVSNSDVSLVSARKYLTDPAKRPDIAAVLTSDNCFEFMEQLGDFARSLEGQDVNDLEELCISIARLADSGPYPARSQVRDGAFSLRSELVAIRAISEFVKSVDRCSSTEVAARLIGDEQCLSVAACLIAQSYLADNNDEIFLISSEDRKAFLMRKFAENVLEAARKDALLNVSNPGYVLWILSKVDSGTCGAVFAAMKTVQPTLDGFAVEILKDSFDSTNGQTYAVPKERDRLEAYCPLEALREHAQQRIGDPTLVYPARAAWRSVVEEKHLYGVDGTEVNR